MRGNVQLFYEENPYEVIEHYAVVGEDRLEMHGYTSERAPGESYGSLNVVEGAALTQLKEALGASDGWLGEALEREFSGEAGLRKFLSFCIERDIDVQCFIS